MDTSMVSSASKGHIRTEGADVERSGGCDSNDMLARLLATATVALDTDCRAAKRYIQRAAVLRGLELSPGGDGRLDDNIQHVRAHVDVEILSWTGGGLISVLLLLYVSLRSKYWTGGGTDPSPSQINQDFVMSMP
jgi:hypothetical protein